MCCCLEVGRIIGFRGKADGDHMGLITGCYWEEAKAGQGKCLANLEKNKNVKIEG